MKLSLRRPGGVLLAGVLVSSTFALMPAVHAVGGGISGTVTGPEGPANPLEEIYISVYEQVEGEWNYVDTGFAVTDAQGHYDIPLATGDYLLQFQDFFTGNYVDEFYDNAVSFDDATPVTVDGGVQQIDVELERASRIEGTVTGPLETSVSDVWVQVYEETIDENNHSWWTGVTFAPVELDGTYVVDGLRAGNYRVGFEHDPGNQADVVWADEFYQDQPTVETAESIVVGTNERVLNINAELAFDSTISGVVTDSASEGLGADVLAFTMVNGDWVRAAHALADANGSYTLRGLPQGTYRVMFVAELGADYVHEAWNNAATLEEGDDIVVGSDENSMGKNAQLIAGEHDPVPFTMTAMPVISGTPHVGSTLTVTSGSWSPVPDEIEMHWFRGEEYTGTSGPTYVPTAADIGQTLSVLVQVYGEGRYDFVNTGSFGPITAAPVPVVVPPAPVVVAPTPVLVPAVSIPAVISFSKSIDVKGPLKVGSTLKLKDFTASMAGESVTTKLQWFAGSKKIKKATRAKLAVTKALQGKKISVKVTATADGTTKTIKVKVGTIR